MDSQAGFSIGWDVGGWNCDQNRNSRDAIVILNDGLQIVGKPWRGNLRDNINKSLDTESWISKLFALCDAAVEPRVQVTMAIDTPLGFPELMLSLAAYLKPAEEIESSSTNPYLFRETERRLHERGFRPLSAIKDMIGSQSTKGMHVLAKFAPKIERCGVWTGGRLTMIETYPAACKKSKLIQRLYSQIEQRPTDADQHDALISALVAHLFRSQRSELVRPSKHVSEKEGWIWLPQDAKP